MNCKTAQEQMVEMLYNELDPTFVPDLLAHLDECSACRQQYEDMKFAADTLDGALAALPQHKLDNDRRQAILIGSDSDKATPIAVAPIPKEFIQMPRVRLFLKVAASLVIAGVLTGIMMFPALKESKKVLARQTNDAVYEKAAKEQGWPTEGDEAEFEEEVIAENVMHAPSDAPSEDNFSAPPSADSYSWSEISDHAPSTNDTIDYDEVRDVARKGSTPNPILAQEKMVRYNSGTRAELTLNEEFPGPVSPIAPMSPISPKKQFGRSSENMAGEQSQTTETKPAVADEASPEELRMAKRKRFLAARKKQRRQRIERSGMQLARRSRAAVETRDSDESTLPAETKAEVAAAKVEKYDYGYSGKVPERQEAGAGLEEKDEPSIFKTTPVNPFVMTSQDKFSTFALDTDTASYTLMRKYINSGQLPPVNSVRMEEYVNAFDYNYPRKSNGVFSVHAEAAPSPFGKDLVLLKVGVRGKVIGRDGRKPANLVFAVDTSGSMARADRMPLVQAGLTTLVDQLDPQDHVSLTTYGRDARLLLDKASAADKDKIKEAINSLQCGESTHLAEGVRLAYEVANRNFVSGAVNSVILCSDGMANLGPQDADGVLKSIESYRRQGVSFNSVGFGQGNYNDNILEQMANRGDGSYVFIDTLEQAKKTFAEEMGQRLNTIARNAKIQVEFNPDRVRRYRLIGYENRDIADKDFRNDSIDAGEVGSGQSATALYELELIDSEPTADFGTVFVRYENVETNKVEEISTRILQDSYQLRIPEQAPHFYLAAVVAEFAEILRQSEHAGDGSFEAVRELAERVAAQLPMDQRVQELNQLIHKSRGLPRGR